MAQKVTGRSQSIARLVSLLKIDDPASSTIPPVWARKNPVVFTLNKPTRFAFYHLICSQLRPGSMVCGLIPYRELGTFGLTASVRSELLQDARRERGVCEAQAPCKWQ